MSNVINQGVTLISSRISSAFFELKQQFTVYILKKEPPSELLFFEFCNIFQRSFSAEQLRASVFIWSCFRRMKLLKGTLSIALFSRVIDTLNYYLLKLYIARAYSNPCQISKSVFQNQLTANKPLIIFVKHSILDVWQGFMYASV